MKMKGRKFFLLSKTNVYVTLRAINLFDFELKPEMKSRTKKPTAEFFSFSSSSVEIHFEVELKPE